jgi:copper(I)-binding protein
MRVGSTMLRLAASAGLVSGCMHAQPTAPGGVTAVRAIIRASEGQSGIDVAAYAAFANPGETDAIVAAECSCAERVELHVVSGEPGQRQMTTDWPLALPGGARAEVAPGSPQHFMLMGITAPIAAGDVHTIRFRLRSGRVVAVQFTGVANSAEGWRAAEPGG